MSVPGAYILQLFPPPRGERNQINLRSGKRIKERGKKKGEGGYGKEWKWKDRLGEEGQKGMIIKGKMERE